MQSRWPGGLVAGAVLLVSAAAASAAPVDRPVATTASRATLKTFAGTWYGHTRSLWIGRHGRAKESLGAGCCDPVIDLRFRLSHPRGTTRRARARVKVTAVHVHDPAAFSAKHPAPHVGEVRRLRLRGGVIHEPLTRTIYCSPEEQYAGTCGA